MRHRTEDGGKDFVVQMDWHVDAFDKVTTARFGVLVQVALSDWDADNMGNLTVYPGSHKRVAELMGQMSWLEWQRAVKQSIDLGVPRVQIHARAGDVILAHPLLAHDVAVNTTDRPRLAAIFRPKFLDGGFRQTLLAGQRGSAPQ